MDIRNVEFSFFPICAKSYQYRFELMFRTQTHRGQASLTERVLALKSKNRYFGGQSFHPTRVLQHQKHKMMFEKPSIVCVCVASTISKIA